MAYILLFIGGVTVLLIRRFSKWPTTGVNDTVKEESIKAETKFRRTQNQKIAHIKNEDIAGLIDRTIDKRDRETFLKHLSKCDDCLTLYCETLKFIEDEKEEKVPFGEKINVPVPRFWEKLGAIFQKPLLIPAAAVLLIVIAQGIYFFIGPSGNGIQKARVQFITQSYEKMTNNYTLAPGTDKINAAVRAGFIVEDLFALAASGDGETDKTSSGLLKELRAEQEIISGITPETGDIHETVKAVERAIEANSLSQSYTLGRFIERSALDTLENKRPAEEEMAKYIKIAVELDLPEGLVNRFRKVGAATGSDARREVWKEIKEIFIM